jgi:hypothetical protein
MVWRVADDLSVVITRHRLTYRGNSKARTTMARIVRMPSEEELPPGKARDFVEVLFWLYRKAHRRPLRDISDAIEKTTTLRVWRAQRRSAAFSEELPSQPTGRL